MKRFHYLVIAALCLMTAAPSWGHGIFFAQRSGRLALIYGEGAEDVDTFQRLDKIVAFKAVDISGAPVNMRLVPVDPMVFVELDAQAAVVAATMDNGFWSLSPSGQWVAKSKDQAPGATTGGRYMKYATHLHVLPTGEVKPLSGQAFQIVPVGSSFPRLKGERLTVRVLYQGKPVPGADVWQDLVTDPGAAPVKTDADGRATITVRNQGLNVVRAEHSTSGADPAKADKTEHFATLSFMLGHGQE